MAFCTNCGAFVPDDSKFCENCGAPVAAPEQNDEPVRVEAEVTYQPSENTYQPVEDAYTPAPAETASPSKGFGIAALVLGILSIVFLCLSWHPVFALIDLVLSIFAIVLGAVGMSRAKKSHASAGLAIAGLVCGIVGTVLSLGFLVCWAACAVTAVSATNGLKSMFDGLEGLDLENIPGL